MLHLPGTLHEGCFSLAPIVSIPCWRKSFAHGWKKSNPGLKGGNFGPRLPPPCLSLLALPPAAASGRTGVTTVLSFPTPAAAAKCARGENWSHSDKRAQGLGPERSSGCKLESQPPSAAPGCCVGHHMPHSSAGLFLSNLQF